MRIYKTFLNPEGDVDSYVAIDVSKFRKNVTIELKIADCDRNVKLYFEAGRGVDKEYYLQKLKRLQVAIDLIEKEITKKR